MQINVFFSPVYLATSWSSVRTKSTQWSCRRSVSFFVYLVFLSLFCLYNPVSPWGFCLVQLFWTTWTRSWTTTSCAAGSGTAGTSQSWAKSSQTTWPTAKPSANLVKMHINPYFPHNSFLCGSFVMFVCGSIKVTAPTQPARICQTSCPRKLKLRWSWLLRSPWEPRCPSRTSKTSATCATRYVCFT